MMQTLSFKLPLPPSKNEIDEVHGMRGVQQQHRAMRRIWAEACGQHLPSLDPPTFVTAFALFAVGQPWDPGNLTTALYSIVFDAIQKPVGTPPGWRQGIHEFKGFIVDDSERHLELGDEPAQRVEPKRQRRCLYLTLEWEEGA